MAYMRLGDLLIAAGAITGEQLQTALQTQLTAAAVLIHPLCPPENCAKQKVQRTFIR